MRKSTATKDSLKGMEVLSVVNDTKSLMEGNMLKNGGGQSIFGGTSFKKRFFALKSGGQLFYWDDEREYKAGKTALKNPILLQGATVIPSEDKKKKEWQIEIKINTENEKKKDEKRIFKLTNELEWKQWIKALEEASRAETDSLSEGRKTSGAEETSTSIPVTSGRVKAVAPSISTAKLIPPSKENLTTNVGVSKEEEESENFKNMKEMRADSLLKRTLNFHDPKYQDHSIAASTLKDLADLIQTSNGVTRRKAATALSQITINLFTYNHLDDKKIIESIVQCLCIDEKEEIGSKEEEEMVDGPVVMETEGAKKDTTLDGKEAILSLVVKSLTCISKNPSTIDKIINSKIKFDPRDGMNHDNITVFTVLRDLNRSFPHISFRLKIAELISTMFNSASTNIKTINSLRKSGGISLLALLLKEDDDLILQHVLGTLQTISKVTLNSRAICETGSFSRLLELLNSSNAFLRGKAVCIVNNVVCAMREDRLIMATIKRESEGAHIALRSLALLENVNTTNGHYALTSLFAIGTLSGIVSNTMTLTEFADSVMR